MAQAAPTKVSLKATPTLWISTLLTGLFCLGIYDFLLEKEDNQCAMSFMYEVPEFIKVPGLDHQKYNLFAYGEGQSAAALKDGIFEGIPVLFIPGNAGSYKQVRSLASIALRKAVEESRYKLHFDYFTVDFKEEYSALYGGTLFDQSEFVRSSVKAILGLYNSQKSKPQSIVLIGHSIGGLIAKSLFIDPGFDAQAVSTIITLATPHQAPVVNADKYLNDFYNVIHTHWNQSTAELDHITMVSVGGGLKDAQVRSGLTVSEHADINVQTTSASGVWVSADHRCIVWCKQLILAINRALFDLIDGKTQQLSSDKDTRHAVFKYHLLHRSGGKKYKADMHPESKAFDLKVGDWRTIDKRQHTFIQDKKLAQNTYLMIPILNEDFESYDKLTIDAVNMDLDNWIFVCKANTEGKCGSGINLSSKSAIIPSNGKRKSITLELSEFRDEHTHVVVFMTKGMHQIRVTTDVYNDRERLVSAVLPKWISFWFDSRLLKMTLKNSLFYNISLAELDQPWQAYRISFEVLQCDQKNSHLGLLKMSNSWANDAHYSLIGPNMTNSIMAMLSVPKPESSTDFHSEIVAYLDPDCRYAISIRPALEAMFGQIVRFYYPFLLPMSISIALMVMAHQLKLLETEGSVYPCYKIIWSQVSPISSVMPARMLGSLVAATVFHQFLPVHDLQILLNQGLDFGMLPIMMYFTSIGFMLVLTFAAHFTVILFGNLFNKFTSKMFNQTELVETAASGIIRYPSVALVIFAIIAMTTCGTLTLCLCTLLHFLRLFKIHKNYLEWLAKKSLGIQDESSHNFDNIHFQMALGLLLALTLALNLPSLLAWSHNLSLGIYKPLNLDHSFVTCFILTLATTCFWKNDALHKFRKHYNYVGHALQFASINIILYGLINPYRINYIITIVTLILLWHQTFAPIDLNKSFIEEGVEAVVNSESDKEKKE